MRILYAKSFERDLAAVRNLPDMRRRLKDVIERLEESDSLDELAGIKRIEGYPAYYRMRIGDYRLGVKLVGDTLELIRFLHRKDIYRRFP
jgi:mRNA interferase RelE/StbE